MHGYVYGIMLPSDECSEDKYGRGKRAGAAWGCWGTGVQVRGWGSSHYAMKKHGGHRTLLWEVMFEQRPEHKSKLFGYLGQVLSRNRI